MFLTEEAIVLYPCPWNSITNYQSRFKLGGGKGTGMGHELEFLNAEH